MAIVYPNERVDDVLSSIYADLTVFRQDMYGDLGDSGFAGVIH
jgi:hypothetical protein